MAIGQRGFAIGTRRFFLPPVFLLLRRAGRVDPLGVPVGAGRRPQAEGKTPAASPRQRAAGVNRTSRRPRPSALATTPGAAWSSSAVWDSGAVRLHDRSPSRRGRPRRLALY